MTTKKPDKQPNKFIQLTGAGLQMGLTIYLGNWLGKWLDATYQKDFIENTLTFIAVIFAMYAVIKQVMNLNND